MSKPSPWEVQPDKERIFTNYGQIEITMEFKRGPSTEYFRINVEGEPINGDFNTNRILFSFHRASYVSIFLPSIQQVVEEHDFLIFPAPPEEVDTVSDPWAFFAKWHMESYRDYSKNALSYWGESKGFTVRTDDKGREYVTLSTFFFEDAFPNQAACIAAMQDEFPDASSDDDDDIPGFDSDDKTVADPVKPDILAMMLNGSWNKDTGQFENLEIVLKAAGGSLADLTTRSTVYDFMATRVEESIAANDNGWGPKGLNLVTVKEAYSEEHGQIDAEEWDNALTPF